VERGLIERVDPARIPSWNKLSPAFRNEWGPGVTLQVDGIAFNPTRVPRPRGYRDLFENRAYDRQVALLGFGSNTALLAWVELNRALGGSEDNMRPMFDLLRSYLPRAGAIANNGGHQQTLFQQGEVAVFFASTNNVARLRSLGVPCEFVQPETGSPGIPVNIHLARGAQDPDAVYAYMEAAISAAVQTELRNPPMDLFPTNEEVPLTPAIEAFIRRDQIASFVQHDWSRINPRRAAWTEEFNRIVRR
jgi:putative spermidine/putrescine transport system substrate-binding protein